MIALLLLFFACSPPDAGSYLAWQFVDGAYRIAPRPQASLQDYGSLDGRWVDAFAGGGLDLYTDGSCGYREGHRLQILYDVDGDVAVPFDEAGLILWSAYGHLEDLQVLLEDIGLGDAGVLPVTLAYTPVIPDLYLEMLPLENAAYANGCHTLLLLEDLVTKDVPLAANAGVIRHEFGHSVFHVLETGDRDAPDPFGAVYTDPDALYNMSLNEGFADMFASLSLDDPDFLLVSLPSQTQRDVSGEKTLENSGIVFPEDFVEENESNPLALYDPYALGTVFASTAWDLREALPTSRDALDLVVLALRNWIDRGELGDVYAFLDELVVVTDDPTARDALCASIQTRFGSRYEVAACD